MRRLVISPKANRDTDNQADNIGSDNIEAALRYLVQLQETYSSILEMPGTGRLYDTHHSRLTGIRMRTVTSYNNYLIFYRYDDDTVDIVRVLHGNQDIVSILENDI